MNSIQPLKLAVGIDSDYLNFELTDGIKDLYTSKAVSKPVHVFRGHSPMIASGFIGIGDMLMSANVHADDVRVQRGADFAIGIAHGPLYIERDEAAGRSALLFDTVFLTFNDEYGIVDAVVPADACPPGTDFIYKELGGLVTALRQARKARIPKEIERLASESLTITTGTLRPWPVEFGVARYPH